MATAAGVLRVGDSLSCLATRLVVPMRCTKSQATAAIYQPLTLVRSCARTLLSRAGSSLVDIFVVFFVLLFSYFNKIILFSYRNN